MSGLAESDSQGAAGEVGANSLGTASQNRSRFSPIPGAAQERQKAICVLIESRPKWKTRLAAGLFGRGDWIRTSDLFVPNEARYQAALRPDCGRGGCVFSGSGQDEIRLRAEGVLEERHGLG